MKTRPYKDVKEFVDVIQGTGKWPDHKSLKRDRQDDDQDTGETLDEVVDRMFPHLRDDAKN